MHSWRLKAKPQLPARYQPCMYPRYIATPLKFQLSFYRPPDRPMRGVRNSTTQTPGPVRRWGAGASGDGIVDLGDSDCEITEPRATRDSVATRSESSRLTGQSTMKPVQKKSANASLFKKSARENLDDDDTAQIGNLISELKLTQASIGTEVRSLMNSSLKEKKQTSYPQEIKSDHLELCIYENHKDYTFPRFLLVVFTIVYPPLFFNIFNDPTGRYRPRSEKTPPSGLTIFSIFHPVSS